MPQSSELYTPHCMRKLEIEAVTTEATDHDIEMAFDWNPDTYWAPTSTTLPQDIDIDLQAAYDIDGLALFMRNYDTDFGVNENVQLYYSDNGTTWYPVNGWLLNDYGSIGEPLKVFPTISESVTAHRWWRIRFSGTATQVVNIAQFILYKKITISQGNQYPENDDTEYRLDIMSQKGRMTLKNRTNRIPIQRFVRNWLFTRDADYENLETAIIRCLGSGYPLILEESSAYYLVEIVDADFNQMKSNEAEYKPTVTFQALPYNADGKGY